jgi:peptidoglycan/LPS O-acetylase OafA/YrhL
MERPDGPGNIAFIQSLRGLAALIVAWVHLAIIPSSLLSAWFYGVATPLRLFQSGGNLGVVTFFLISGFIVTYTSLNETRFSFAVKRFMRLFPMLWVAMAVTAGCALLAAAIGLTSHFYVPTAGPLRWIASLFLLDGFSSGHVLEVTWTLVVELMFYVLTFAFMTVSSRNIEWSAWWMTIVWAVFSMLFSVVPLLRNTANGSLIFSVAFLLIGRNIYLWHSGKIRPIGAFLNAAAAGLLYGAFLETRFPGALMSPVGFEPLITYGYALIIFVGFLTIGPKSTWQPFRFLGDISYSLYLLHLPVGFVVTDLLLMLSWPNELITVSAIVVSVGVSWVTYQLVEMPSQRLARRFVAARRRKSIPSTGAIAA